ncbi:MAG: DNA methyltransferase [Lactobacillus sp.]|jgi:hypothetical protein|nr:DNA methyltransferase [Lactobacillus sp.]MCH4068156.1 DNA methyltransferase [Lactobacillus sp.]MCI1304337.1 DNA methyltransferase [Lactobacillus sp.]MCI1330087.1 DNA methyltransferase [Lactobacillus sp.]MCI1399686.1 DNA methyltransferase [Lactobacillus sp.]
MSEEIIKSSDRVKDIGEVFTPKKIVNFMLDQPEIQAKVNNLSATFLEPSAGEGAFLTEILNRKLKVAFNKSKTIKGLNDNFLLTLSSLYGIELMEDNVEMLVMNMNETFQREYLSAMDTFKVKPNRNVLESAKIIIRANMAQGDALTRRTNTGEPIIFSEWKELQSQRGIRKVQRTEYTFDSIVEGTGPKGFVSQHSEQLDLFSSYENAQIKKPTSKRYLPVKWEYVYKQLVE